jgi:hypothetical protein
MFTSSHYIEGRWPNVSLAALSLIFLFWVAAQFPLIDSNNQMINVQTKEHFMFC